MGISLHKMYLTMLCLSVAVGLGYGCNDDDSDNGGPINVADAGDTGGGGGGEETGDIGGSPDGEGSADGGDAREGADTDGFTSVGCDIDGLTLPDDLYISEDTPFDNWGVYRVHDGEYIELSLVRDASLDGVGTLDFSVPSTSNDAYLLLGTDCDAEGCETYYNAESGTLEVTTFDKSVLGSFKAKLRNVRLAELDASGHAAQEGKTWCVATAEIEATTHPLPTFDAPVCTESSARNGFAGSEKEVLLSEDGWMSIWEASSADFPRDELNFMLNEEYALNTPYAIDDVNAATCTACLWIESGCAAGGSCTTRYNAGAGTLTINALDMGTGEFEATLEDAQLVEVTQVGDYTVITENGGGWCIDSYTFSGTIAPAAP